MPEFTPVPPAGNSNIPIKNPMGGDPGGFTPIAPSDGPGLYSTSVSRLDQSDYRFQLKTGAGVDNNKLRAQDQGFWETLGIRMANMPFNILTGMGEMVGYGAALLTERGEERDYTNGLTELMQSWKNPFGEIYRENPGEVIDMTDSAWWIDNLGGLVESATQFAIPAAGIGSGFRALAQAASWGRKSLTGLKAAGQVATAGTLAYMEGAISGNEIYHRTYNTQYLQSLARGNDGHTAHREANAIASKAAATTVQANVLMNTLLNMTALAPLFRGSQDKIMDFMRFNAVRAGKETASEFKDRLIKMATESGVLKNRSGITSYLSEAFQEGLEEVNTQYAESLGERVASGEKVSLKEALLDFSTALKTVSNEEGILNFALGALGGVGQTVILDNIPVHRTQVQGADGKMERKLVSSRTLNADGTRKYFDSIVDAVASDVEVFEKRMKDLKEAVDKKDDIAAEEIRYSMFDTLALNAVQMGMGDNWISTFEQIANTSNTADTASLQQQLDDINAQIQQTTDPQLQTQLQQAKQAIIQQQANPQSEAMQRGLAKDLNDNSYKTRAQEAIRDLKAYQKIYDDIIGTYSSEEEVALGIPDYLFIQKSNLYRQERMLEKAIEDEQKLAAEHELEFAGLRTTAEMFNKDAARLNEVYETYRKVQERIMGDSAEFEKAVKSGDIAGVEKIMSRHKVLGYMGEDMVEETRRRMRKQFDAAGKAMDDARASMEKHTGFTEWQANNPGKTVDDFAKMLKKEYGARKELVGLRSNIAHLQDVVKQNRTRVSDLMSDSGNMRKTIDTLKPILKKRAQEMTKKMIEEEIASQQQRNAAEAHNVLNEQAVQGQERELSRRLVQVNNQIVATDTEIKNRQERIAKLNITSHSAWNVSWRAKMAIAKSDLKALQKTKTDLIAQRDTLVEELNRLRGIETVQSVEEDTTNSPEPTPDPTPDPAPDPDPDPAPEPEPGPAPDSGGTKVTDPQVAAAAKYEGLVKRISSGRVLAALTEVENTMKSGIPVTLEEFMARPDVVAALNEGDTFRRAVTSAFTALEEYISTLNITPSPETTTEETGETTEETGEETGGETEEETTTTTTVTPSPVTVQNGQNTTEGADVEVDSLGPVHAEKKTTNILKINTNTLLTSDWRDSSNDWRISGKELNPNAHPYILDPNQLGRGTELFLSVDYKYNGPLKIYGTSEYENGTIAKFQDADGKIRDWENVPIQITTADGKIIGYLPTMGWLQEQYEDVDEASPEHKRNIVMGWWLDQEQTQWFDNLAEQTSVLKKIRELVRDAGTVRGVVSEKGTGSVILNKERDPRDDTKFITVPGPALSTDPQASLLPGDVTLAVVSKTGSLYTAKGQTVSVANQETAGRYTNMPMALLPMANGELVATPLYMPKLEDEPSLRTIERAIVLHLSKTAEAQKEIDDFFAMSGYNLANPDDLRRFINNQFTYTQSFDATHTALDPNVTQDFLFNIVTPKAGGKALIMVGIQGSGTKPLIAMIKGDKLDPVFSELLRAGLAEQRYKNVNFAQNNQPGINSKEAFNEYYFNKNGWQKISYRNYNDYVKMYATTTVYGRNQQKGQYVYSANPGIFLDPDSLIGIKGPNTSPTLVQEEAPAQDALENQGQEVNLSSDEAEDLLGGLAFNLTRPLQEPSTPSYIEPSDSMQPVTMDFLQNLYNFTPPGDRNNVTVEQAYQKLLELKTPFVAEGYNPFLKCK